MSNPKWDEKKFKPGPDPDASAVLPARVTGCSGSFCTSWPRTSRNMVRVLSAFAALRNRFGISPSSRP